MEGEVSDPVFVLKLGEEELLRLLLFDTTEEIPYFLLQFKDSPGNSFSGK